MDVDCDADVTGAYYYYYTEPDPSGKGRATYEQTLLDVHAYAQQEHIPYKYVLLDSWWYTKGKAGGVAQWDATPQTFPSGHFIVMLCSLL